MNETSFLNLKKKFFMNTNIKILDLVNSKMDKFKAHNPLVDSFMTIFVFILMKK
jgi:hypothetical protein